MNPEIAPLQVVVAEDDPETRDFLKKTLENLGHKVVAVENGHQLVERCRAGWPDLVVTDIKMPGLTGLQAAEMINQEKPVPFVLVTGHADAIILQGQHAYIMACLSKPIRPVDLIISITLARKRFEEYQHMTREANNLRQALEDRKLIERAKGTAMKRLRIDEEEAFVRLQRLASERNTKLAEIARQVIVADEIFQHLDRL